MQSTDSQNLKSKALTGSFWTLLENFATQIIQFVVGIILARLLGPKDYGLIAVTGIFTAISSAITDAGFEKTLIREKQLSQLQISTIFYINALLGLLITLLFICLAPFIASFFNEPKLTVILQVVSVGILITSLGQTQQAILIKEFQLKKISYSRVISSIISGVTGLVLAYNDFGVWALVYSGLSYQVTCVLFFWIQATWYPKLIFSLASVKPMIPYGINILGSSILFFLNQQFNNFVVGKFYSKIELGLFTRGNRFPELIVSVIQSVVLKMTLPLFAKLQDDNERLNDAVLKTNKVIAFVSFPLLMLLLIKAHDITIFLFTEKWIGSIIFLQLFCVIKLFEPFITVQRELLLAQGKAKLLFKVFVLTCVFEIVLTFFVIRYGIIYVVFVSLISRVGQYLLYTFTNAKRLGIKNIAQFNWVKPYILITLGMVLIIIGVDYVFKIVEINISLFAKLCIELLLGILLYTFMAFKIKVEEFGLIKAVYDIVLKKIKK